MNNSVVATTHSFDAGRAAVAGLVAGLAFVIAEMLLVMTIGGGSPWGPPRMMAAIVMGEGVLPGPDNPPTFALVPMMVGMIVHFVLSIVLGLIFAFAVSLTSLGKGMIILMGAVFGLLVYVVNFYGLTILFPWFSMARNAITIFSHALFGAVLAWVYVRD